MAMPRVTTNSTSNWTAEAEPIELRAGTTTRLVFKPQLVENTTNPNAGVNGCFVWQRKGPKEVWRDIREVSLATLKKGEGYALELHAAELLRLYQGLGDLYSVHRSHGVPRGHRTFVLAEETLERILGLEDQELGRVSLQSRRALARLLRWAVSQPDLVDRLVDLGKDEAAALRRLSSLVGVAALNDALRIWDEQTDSGEAFWHQVLVKHPILLQQLFAYPVIIVKDKAYVGGKSVLDTGGNLADFLLRNELTCNAALVEIKTPNTPLLGSMYRNRTYNISAETVGAVMQAITNRKSLTREIDGLQKDLHAPLDSSAPGCFVVAGSTKQLDSPDKKQAFELFRGELRDVQLVTFDELFLRARRLVRLIETGV